VKVVRRRNLLERPPEVRDEERRRTGNGGELVIVDEDDSGPTDQALEVGEVEEDAVEAMVPVHECEVEQPPFGEEARERRLRFLFVVVNEPGDARLREELLAAVGEACCLVRVDGDVMCLWLTAVKQAFTDEEGRDAVPEADLDSAGGTLANDPVA
jgi:hypothetical protein